MTLNDDDLMEETLRSLKPGSLPQDLRERLVNEPEIPAKLGIGLSVWLGAAAALIAACLAIFASRSAVDRMGPDPSPDDPPSYISVARQDSTLVSSRTLAVKKHEGQLWEVVEQEWRDDALALCSATPIKLRSSVVRREIVYSPVEFQ